MDRPTAMTETAFALNGCAVGVEAPAGARLSESLRERLGAREVKVGCNAGDCGACTVLVDGEPVCACLMATEQARGCSVETAAGLARRDPVAQRLAESFHAHGAAQCGICTPAMLVAATALLRAIPAPTEAEARDALGGVLCRCTGYRKIIDAVLATALPALPGSDGPGAAIPRLDGRAKITGDERFGDDVAPPDALVLRAIRSPHSAARFAFGDLDAYLHDTPGLIAILTAVDVPGLNRFGVIPGFIDQPVFAETHARFRGEAVAAVIGTAKAMRVFDPTAFPVAWTPETPIESPAEAETAPLLHEGRPGNLLTQGFVRTGDAGAALARAAVTVEGRFRTSFVEHAYIEPEAGFARLTGDRIEVHACTQAPAMDRDTLAEILGWPKSRVRVVPTATGGGFGSKIDVSLQPMLALAAIRTGRPVRMTYGRVESMQSTTKRHPAEMEMRIGADAAGKISGIAFEGRFDTGAYSSWGPTVASRVPVHASGPYRVTDYIARARGIFTNNPVAGAFRGFGVPQAAIAGESLIDELAAKLGADPLDFRLLNALENGTPTVCGQVFALGVGIRACLEGLRPAWGREREAAKAFNAKNTTLKRGAGIAAGWYGCGNTGLPNPSTIRAGIRADGTVVLHQGAVDIGQGSNTVITQIFAAALGVPTASIALVGGDTDLTPDAGKTSASRQTFISGNAARAAGAALRRQILARVNAGEGAVIRAGGGKIRIEDAGAAHVIDLLALGTTHDAYVFEAVETYDPPTKGLDENGQGEPYAQYGYAAHLAVVEVDIRLGTVKVVAYTAAHDVGKAINPILVEGQVHGGVAQGIGMALMEEYIPGRTENLHDYLIPTIGDIPPIETIIVEEADAHGPYGAKGLGEHCLIPTAPAVLNAIKAATGARITHVPATPSRVLAALKEVRHGR